MRKTVHHALVSLSFSGFWVAGTGGGKGRLLDLACSRDRHGFPAMPMSQVKGTLRETAMRLCDDPQSGWTEKRVKKIFGKPSDGEGDGPDAAVAFLDTAEVGDAFRNGVADDDIPHLFRRVASTAMTENGVADDRTLRAIEVSVPLELQGRLEWVSGEEPDFDWIELLDRAAAATLSLGALKNDGYGRVVGRVVADDRAGQDDDAARPARAASRRLQLELSASRSAVFSSRAATEGAHKTNLAPTGASLLGWVAGTGRYLDFEDPFLVFHSGAVRFGSALPRTADGVGYIPTPKLFMRRKNSDDPGIRIGWPSAPDSGSDDRKSRQDKARSEDQEFVQYTGESRPFVTPDGRFLSPKREHHLRTAIKEQRASRSQLFGYESLVANDARSFVSEIEIDERVSDADAERIIAALDGRTLRLGKAKGTGHGGGFGARVLETAAAPTPLSPGFTGPVRVLALSDLALVDALGAPTATPPAEMFGLGNAAFRPQDSAVRCRRHAPWNAHLRTRDVERMVIEAGSVLSYEVTDPLGEAVPARQVVGLWREAGLGTVWLNPPFLDGERPLFADQPENIAQTRPNLRNAPDRTGLWPGWFARIHAEREG